MNDNVKKLLGYYLPYYEAVLKEINTANGCDISDLFDDVIQKDFITSAELDQVIHAIRARVGDHLTYSQGQNIVFKALGYRSSGLAYEIRKVYSQNKNATELLHPNLWVEFLYVSLDDSVFGSFDYCKEKLSLHFMEFVFEPVIRGLVTEELALKGVPELEAACLTMQVIARQKTMSVAMARTMAEQIQHELGGVVRHTTALNLVGIALGYKTWANALGAARFESITNTRYVSKFAAKPATPEVVEFQYALENEAVA